jgi:creatinine amidohydrolase
MSTSNHEDMHAGELETSVLLSEFPELVRDGYQTADHVANDRDALLTYGMAHYTQTGIVGRPSLASAAKGIAVVANLTDAFAACLKLLSSHSRPQ